MKPTTNYIVVLTEYERGWGSKDFHAVECETLDQAIAHETETNSHNTKPTVPDYYIVARIETDPRKFSNYERLL